VYDTFLIKHCIANISEKTNYKLFSYSTLSENGLDFDCGRIRLLADEDILFLMKNIYPTECTDEYFDRNRRRRPIWKSESYYKALSSSDDKHVNNVLWQLGGNKVSWYGGFFVNDCFQRKLENDAIESVNRGKKLRLERIENDKKLVACLREIASFFNIDFDFAICFVSSFDSNFSKSEVAEIPVFFPGNAYRFKDVSSVLKSEASDERFFYIFYRPNSTLKDGEERQIVLDPRRFKRKLTDMITDADIKHYGDLDQSAKFQ
jgi:hypothetical protein